MATELNQDDKERKRIKRGSKLQGQKVHEIKQEATESETRQKLRRQTGRQKHEHNKKTRRRKSKRNHFYKQRVKVKSDLQKKYKRQVDTKFLHGMQTSLRLENVVLTSLSSPGEKLYLTVSTVVTTGGSKNGYQ